ncbi:hypothetical protein TrVE_jg13007 [Triparma verrucosa]|uniref:Protein CASP n=1 Tax=Triparma verrucosa TaxID=1606542 RepID=A0A9W7B1H9_9STRA|nr:hypothetical protein TrVE_jg13007 [Triparma verrucosa]
MSSDVRSLVSGLLGALNESSESLEQEKLRSITAKKELGKATKEFRQSNSPDLSSFKSLLKAYQAEIDALSKASKRSEEVVQSLHNGLKDVGGNLEGQLEDDGDGDGEEVKGLREENERLKAAAAEAEGSSEGLREENEKLKAMSLANVALSEESLKKANAEIESLKADLLARADGNADSDALREENESLKAMVKAKVEENERLKEGQESAANQLREELRLKDKVEEATMQVDMYRSQLDAASTSQHALSSEVSNLKATIAEMQARAKADSAEVSKLKSVTKSASGHAETIKKLRQEISEYEEEFKSLKNQDLTISKLNKQIKQLQAGGDEDVSRRVEEEREEIEERAEEKVQEALEREAESLRRVEQLELDLKAERAGKQALDNNLTKAHEGSGSMEAAFAEQRKIFLQDSERLNVELHDLKLERDALKLKLSVGGKGNEDGWEMEKEGYEAELREVSGLLAESREQIKTLMEDVDKASQGLKAQVAVTSELELKHKAEVEGLKRELKAAPSVGAFNNMKRDLSILRKLTGGGGGDGEDGEGEGEDDWAGDEDIDNVVLARCQKLETDLMKTLQAKEEISKVSEERKVMLAGLEEEKAGLENLISQLEEESATLQAKLTEGEGGGEGGEAGGLGGLGGGAKGKGGGGGALLQTILDANTPVKAGGGLPASPMPPFTPGVDGDVQGILMSQRDRLKEKVGGLEKMRDGLKKELAEQVRVSEGLRAQNQSLYERVRFAESSFGGGGGGGGGVINDVESLEEGFSRKHDPFADFQRAARKKQLDKLGPVEKVVYSVLRVASGHREARLGLFGYTLALHFLIFVTTYHWAHEMTCGDVLHPDLQGHAHAVAMHGGVPNIEDHLMPEGGGG